MRKPILNIFLISIFCLSLPAFAAEEMPSDGMQGMQMPPSEPAGKLIRETTVDAYRLSYRLIDLQAQMKGMQGMQHNMQEMGTHHLMLFIKDANGKNIDSAQAGYLIIGPDGAEQKVMAMAMSGGYGADINLSKPGAYTIKSKAVFGDKKLLDEFTYQIGQ